MNTTIYLIITAILIAYGTLSKGAQPAYQVSLYIHLHPKERPIHLCNGAIVQSRLVLTSASCVHYHFVSDSPMVPIHSSMISVIAGSADAFSDALIYQVLSINVYEKFNSTTMENDLAILRLSSLMPLDTRDDMKWIILDDDEFNDNPCLANFYVRNSMDNIPDYTQTEELTILEPQECNQLINYPNFRGNDICSHYVLPFGFECNAFDAFIPYNGDRGTGLVCNSRLVGILSTILSLPQDINGTDCSEIYIKAWYTNIGPHLDWIYKIISYEEYIAITEDNYSASAPYQFESSALLQSNTANFTSDLGLKGHDETTDSGLTTQIHFYHLTNDSPKNVLFKTNNIVLVLLALIAKIIFKYW